MAGAEERERERVFSKASPFERIMGSTNGELLVHPPTFLTEIYQELSTENNLATYLK